MKGINKPTRAFTITAAASLILAACGSGSPSSSSSSGSSSTTSAATAASPGVDIATKTITIGASGPKTGPQAAFGEGTTAAAAEAAYYNAQGGINGWKIKYITLNDQYLPANAITDAQELVNSDHVFAVVGMVGTPNGTAVLPYLASQNVPDIGFSLETGAIANNTTFKNAPLFGFQIPYGEISTFDVNWLKSQGVTNMSLAYQDDQVGTAVLPGVQYGAQKDGITIAAVAPVPDTATDFSGYAAKLKAANAPWVLGWLPPPALAGLIKTCASIGYTPHWLAPFFDPIPAVFNVIGPQLSNGMDFESWLTPLGTAAAQTMVNTIKQYSTDQKPSVLGELGWIGMGVFIHALRVATAGGKVPTRESIIAALENGQSFEPGHIGFSVSYSKTSRIPVGSDTIYQYNNGTLSKIYGPSPVPTIPSSYLH